MKNKWSKKGILFASIASFSLFLIGLFDVIDYFQEKANKWNSTIWDVLLVIVIVAFGILAIVFFVLSFVYGIKEPETKKGKLVSLSPLLFGLVSIVTCIGIKEIDYANSDLAIWGMPKSYQEKLQVSYILEEGEKLEAPEILLDNESQTKKDSSHAFTDQLKTINVSSYLQGDGYYYDTHCIKYIIGNDDFYGLTIYDTGYIKASYEGDILGPSFCLYYSFNSNEFASLYQLASSLENC